MSLLWTDLEEETEADPLVVFDVLFVRFISRRSIDARMGYLKAHFLEMSAVNGVRTVDPTVRIEYVLGDILGVDAVDRITDVLPRRHDETEGEQDHHRDAVVQPEDGRVDVDVADFDEVLETAEYVQHGGRFLASRNALTVKRRESFEWFQSNLLLIQSSFNTPQLSFSLLFQNIISLFTVSVCYCSVHHFSLFCLCTMMTSCGRRRRRGSK